MLFPREFRPHPLLAPYVKCYWTLEGSVGNCGRDGGPVEWRKQFLADAGLKIGFNLADPVNFVLQDNRVIPASRGLACGVLTKNYWVVLKGSVRRIGVQFHPGGAYPFFPFPVKKLTDTFAAVERIWSKSGRLLTEAVHQDDSTTKERIGLIEAFLLQRLKRFAKLDPDFDRAVQGIRAGHGQVALANLAGHLGVSLKQLERKFVEHSGIPPKRLCGILRFRYLFEHITAHPTDKWVDTALACGYYDQAHLINDFKIFTGMSPAVFIREIVNRDLFINWGYDMEALAGFGTSVRMGSDPLLAHVKR